MGGRDIGIEVAVVLRQIGLEVDVVEVLPQMLMATTEPEFITDRLAKVEKYTAGFLIFLVLVTTALALTFSRTVTRPLETLSRAVQKLGQGDFEARVRMPGTLGDIVADVNREFVKDAEDSAQFMTLVLARIDRGDNRINWVRAGHDPAILYDPDTDSFSSLNDVNGMALAISQDAVYTGSCCDIKPGQIVFGHRRYLGST